eukprot:TRINITY_DN10965_c0_g1_i5.p1 TRINITY_DN10965_c0_g1~~TRINITY_DN10965_c0_g1_i5.p1  ORF type:complete len:310 (+),score=50.97 TRINITY_DN10965_c0_g1_i5:123-1052(+)
MRLRKGRSNIINVVQFGGPLSENDDCSVLASQMAAQGSEELHVIITQLLNVHTQRMPVSLQLSSLAIKLELAETILDPTQGLPSDCSTPLQIVTSGPARRSRPKAPVLRSVAAKSRAHTSDYTVQLHCLNRVKNVCETLVYGPMYALLPSSDTLLDFDQLDEQQQVYAAVANSLKEEQTSLLVSNKQDAKALRGLYIITASDDQEEAPMLFIKPIVGRELLLGDRTSLDTVDVPEEIQANVNRLLGKLDEVETYNPLNFSLNIERDVIASLVKLDRRDQAQKKVAAAKRSQNRSIKTKKSKIMPLSTNV